MAVETIIQIRRGTASAWNTTNPVLAVGEIGFETDTNKSKVGNGSTTWLGLSYTVATTDPMNDNKLSAIILMDVGV